MDSNPPIAKKFLLKLLSVVDQGTLDITLAIKAGSVFDITPNNIRVAINRLHGSELIEPISRGVYQLSSKGKILRDEVSSWHKAEDLTNHWDNSWLAVLTSKIDKSNRTNLRNTNRAFALIGMKELYPDLYIRPNNINLKIDGIRNKLLSLGADANIVMFQAIAFENFDISSAKDLWNTYEIDKSYTVQTQILNESLSKLKELPLKKAAQETYILGDSAITKIIFDPLLPPPLISAQSRIEFRKTLIEYDKIGHEIWKEFLRSSI